MPGGTQETVTYFTAGDALGADVAGEVDREGAGMWMWTTRFQLPRRAKGEPRRL